MQMEKFSLLKFETPIKNEAGKLGKFLIYRL